MRTFVLFLAFAVAAPAVAAEHGPPATADLPPDVMLLVDSAPPKSEVVSWAPAFQRFSATAPKPTLDGVPALLGSMVGAPKLDGLDFARPLHLILLNPTKYPHPVLIVPVKKLAALKASVKEVNLAVTPLGSYAAVGDAAAITAVGALAKARLSVAPKQGIHALVYMQPVWSAFGPLAKAMVAMQFSGKPAATPAKPGAKEAPGQLPERLQKMVGTVLTQLLSAFEQSDLLSLDLFGDQSGTRLTLTLDVKPGTPLDGTFSVQPASDFSLIGKLPNQPYTVLAAGHMNADLVKDWVYDLLIGEDGKAHDALRAQWNEFCELLGNGEVAVLGQSVDPTAVEMTSLFAVKDPKRAFEAYPKVSAIFDKSSMLAQLVKITRAPLPPVTIDGQQVGRLKVESDYDTSKMPEWKGPKHSTMVLAWTAFEGLLGLHNSPPGGNATAGNDGIGALIASVRHGEKTLALDASTKASIDEARTLKDSIWMRMDLAAIMARAQSKGAAAAAASVPPTIVPTIGLGFGPHRARLRLSL